VDAYACTNFFAMRPRELAYLNVAAQAEVGEIDVEKATSEGRLQVFTVGQTIPTPSPSPTPKIEVRSATPTELPATLTVTTSAVGANEPSSTPAPQPTTTPMPTAIPETSGGISTPGRAAPAAACGEVISPAPFLNLTLIPAALVVAGAGLAALRRFKQPGIETPAEKENIDDGNQKE
jgi:hypothetical protein